MKKVLEQCDDHEGSCCEVQMIALYYYMNSLNWQGRWDESADVQQRLGEMIVPDSELPLPYDGAGVLQRPTICTTESVRKQPSATTMPRNGFGKPWRLTKAVVVQEVIKCAGQCTSLVGACGKPGGQRKHKRGCDECSKSRNPNGGRTISKLA